MKSGWRKVKLRDVCKIEKGKIGITKAIEGEYPLVVTAQERLSHSEWHFDKPAVMVPLVSSTGHGHASIKRLHYAKGKYAVGSILAVLTPINGNELNARYLHIYLTIHKEKLLVSQMTGAANVTLTLTKLNEVEVEIPDLDTQESIIEKYESSESFEYKSREQIDCRASVLELLRQQILQDAINGRLSEQWRRAQPNVESAEVLLEKVKAEKGKLIEGGKVKKQKPLLPVKESEVPFNLPKGWVWCKLGEIIDSFIGGYSYKSHLFVSSGRNQVLRLGNVKNNRILFDTNPVYIENELAEETSNFRIKEGDILITMTGTRRKEDYSFTHRVTRNDLEGRNLFLNQRVGSLRVSPYVDAEYFNSILKEDSLLAQIFVTATGSANQANIGALAIRNWILPVPPMKEQRRIVRKIDFLFTRLSQIESNNVKNQTGMDLLKQVLLEELFQE